MASEHEQFPHTKRLCKLFRNLQCKRGLVSTHFSTSEFGGFSLNNKIVTVLEDMVQGKSPCMLTMEQTTELEKNARDARQTLLLGELIDHGLVPTHSHPPEPAGTAHPMIHKLLAESYLAESIPVGVRVERPDVF